MPEPAASRTLRHLTISEGGKAERFTRPGQPITPRVVLRARVSHADRLLRALAEARSAMPATATARTSLALATDEGLLLEFESHPGFALKVGSLDTQASGCRLLNVRTRIDGTGADERLVELATVKVTRGGLAKLIEKLSDYRDEQTKKGNPCHAALVDPIEHIRVATLAALWNEDPENPMPQPGIAAVWEAWLHTGDAGETEQERSAVEERFGRAATAAGAEVLPPRLVLPETTVRLIRATRDQIAGSWALLDCLTELRAPAVTAEFFTAQSPAEQRAWMDNLLTRLRPPGRQANAVCLLDSGVNDGHPLLRPIIPMDGLETYAAAWGTNDGHPYNGHGTPMAGLAAYGDLRAALTSALPVEVGHHVESVKMIAPNQGARDDARLYAEITTESVARIEARAPLRRRVFSMQVTAPNSAARGRPTAWSAAIDQIASAARERETPHRFVCVSAGNTPLARAEDYPSDNETAQVHDPAQAWNAVTVGGCTDLIRIDPMVGTGTTPLAAAGDLAPMSTTSLIWERDWPLKPDVVFEAGNFSTDAQGNLDTADALSLLSTSASFASKPFTTTGDTSAAAVQVARIAAMLQRDYPSLWPETLRALIVHSAEWTPAMLGGRRLRDLPKAEITTLLRRCGFGQADALRASRCARNALTLVVQDSLQPYRIATASRAVANEMKVHALPWPSDALRGLRAETDVTLRVTLSYFIEPNPGPRRSNNRYRYASANLRFDLRRPTENLREFRARINSLARDTEVSGGAPGDSDRWVVGSDGRHRGSVHCDLWIGPAAELAEKNHIAVYPVGGWWKERPHLGRADHRVRYSLVISIAAPDVAVDLYTPVEAQIGVPVAVGAGLS
jgi:Subtilase family